MTDLTVTQTLAIGLPIAFFIIFLEAVFSTWQKKATTKHQTLFVLWVYWLETWR